tara:strand:+ start:9010 stop:9354 length:345 start_codon:yes stop_codon:yes gene_type:complete
MSFVLKQGNSYKWPVVHDMPVDGGKHERHTFDAEFKRITQSRIRQMGEQIDNNEITESELVTEVLLGWDGINDDDGNPIKFSQKALDQVIDVPMLATSISKAFFDSIAGAKRKN